jgi:hypothetical protein
MLCFYFANLSLVNQALAVDHAMSEENYFSQLKYLTINEIGPVREWIGGQRVNGGAK